jgi:RimJ/RimL family protein N-acetyltransferase
MKIKLRKFKFRDYLRILFMTLNKKYSREREDTFFSYFFKGLRSVFQKDSYEFAILVNGKFVGNIGIINSKKGYELGYMILRDYRGKGIATKAVEEIMKFGFRELNIPKIFAITDLKNEASKKILIENKFKSIGNNKNKKGIIWERVR